HQYRKMHWFGVAAIYFGMTAALSSFVSGGTLIVNLDFTQSIWSIIFGTIALVFIFYVPLGLIGAKEGLNTYIIAESAFGEKGSSIAAALVITIIPCVGWYGVQVSIAADALSLGLGLSDEVWAPIFMILL